MNHQENLQFNAKLIYNPTSEFPFVYSSDSIVQQNITAVAWTNENIKSPCTFNDFSLPLIKKMQDAGSVFGRKFAPTSVTLEELAKCVLTST